MRLAKVPAQDFHRPHAVVAMLLVAEGTMLGHMDTKNHTALHYTFDAGHAHLADWLDWTMLAQSVANAPTFRRARCVPGVWRR